MRKITIKCLIMATLILSGCSFNGGPRPRLGSYATDTPGTNFIDLDSIGRHSYKNSLAERNGIVYTCRGGHIDIAHLRIAADYTRYLNEKIKECLNNGQQEFNYKLNVEPSVYDAKIQYPKGWDKMNESRKEDVINKVSIELAQYLTFNMTTWHEVLTWYGYKCMGFIPETPSAFSWEDIYSNLLGTRLAAAAIADSEHDYDEAMTIAIKNEFEYLGVQSAQTAKMAAARMYGTWYNGVLFVDMKQRNMDTGRDDGFVSPILVPEISECPDANPKSYPVPELDKFNDYGFKVDVNISPREFEKGKILQVAHHSQEKDKINLTVDLPVILDGVEKEAQAKGCITMPY